ncbi:MAG TPA: hypothetical protein PLR99_04560 [Polyangiaceae bacterium]|nr:hypothetical protein [Polyangiaceae bacterium]
MNDARALLAASPLQAYHLAGFGPECARKALPGVATLAKQLGHTIDADEALATLFAALDPALHRYPVFGWATRFPTYASWRPDVRYAATADQRRLAAAQVTDEAEAALEEVLYALYADGTAPAEAFQ